MAPWATSLKLARSHCGVKSKGVRDGVPADCAAVKSVGGQSAKRVLSSLEVKDSQYLLITFCTFI